jgi:hypothetical protein
MDQDGWTALRPPEGAGWKRRDGLSCRRCHRLQRWVVDLERFPSGSDLVPIEFLGGFLHLSVAGVS